MKAPTTKQIGFISLFLEPLQIYLKTSMMAKATAIGAASFSFWDLRDYGLGPHKQVDDRPYGGGDGMVLMIEPLATAIVAAREALAPAIVCLLTPRGDQFSQTEAVSLAASRHNLVLVGGFYEGYDERVVDFVDRQFSIGDYVITSANLAALTVADAVVRLIPGVLGGPTSASADSFMGPDGAIEHPHYTKPAVYQGRAVPDVLVSGNHQAIAAWRQQSQRSLRPKGQ